LKLPSFRLTEAGEGSVTINLLLDTIADAIRRGVLSGGVTDPSCAHLIGAMETLGKMGLVDVDDDPNKPAGKPPISTSPKEPPKWLLSAFEKKEDDPDGGSPASV
jgi:hypothetical protein